MKQLTSMEATPKNAKHVAEVLTSAVERKLDYGDNSWGTEPFSETEVLGYIESSYTYLFYFGDRIVGTVSVTWMDEGNWGKQPAVAGYIHRLAAVPDKKGTGSEILSWAENKIAAQGLNYARLDCDDSNKSLCRYYEKQGYRKVSTAPPSESGYVAALYEKELATHCSYIGV